ncbi:MAG: hypothetical protein WD845_14185, partial [Pirellulales bacterium]
MKRSFSSTAILSAIVWLPAAAAIAQNTPLVRHVDLTYTVEIPEVPAGATTIDLWIPIPITDGRQTVTLVNESELAGGQITTEQKFGNRMYHRRFQAPLSPVKIQFRYDAEVREQSVSAAKQLPASRQIKPSAELAPYLGNVAMIPIEGRISQL